MKTISFPFIMRDNTHSVPFILSSKSITFPFGLGKSSIQFPFIISVGTGGDIPVEGQVYVYPDISRLVLNSSSILTTGKAVSIEDIAGYLNLSGELVGTIKSILIGIASSSAGSLMGTTLGELDPYMLGIVDSMTFGGSQGDPASSRLVLATSKVTTIINDPYYYYPSLYEAVTDMNNGFARGSTASAESAKVVVDNTGSQVSMQLLDDCGETEIITPQVSFSLDLAGHKISTTAARFISYDSSTAIDVTINGQTTGSEVELRSPNAALMLAYWRYTGNDNATLKIVGGKYSLFGESSFGAAFYAIAGGSINLDSCNIVVRGSGSAVSSQFAGVLAYNSDPISLKDCNIDTRYTGSGDAYTLGVWNIGSNVTADGTRIFVDAPYYEEGVCASTYGILNHNSASVLNLKDCHITGVNSGVFDMGTTNVDGGIYEAIAHGGFVFGGVNTVAHVRNATLRDGDYQGSLMPPGLSLNYVSFYFTWNLTDVVNPTVYMDNCILSGRAGTDFVSFKRSRKCKLYISNTNIPDGKFVRIDQLLRDYDPQGRIYTYPDTPDDYNMIYIGENCNLYDTNTSTLRADKIYMRTARYWNNGVEWSDIVLADDVQYTPRANETLTRDTAKIEEHLVYTGENYGSQS